jgi:hypothetical protein
MLPTGTTAVGAPGSEVAPARAPIVGTAGPLDGHDARLDGHDGRLPTTGGAPPLDAVIGTAAGSRVRYRRRVLQVCPREAAAWVYDYDDAL